MNDAEPLPHQLSCPRLTVWQMQHCMSAQEAGDGRVLVAESLQPLGSCPPSPVVKSSRP